MPPKRNGSSDRGDQRRLALLAALEALIEERTYHDIGVAEISKRAGVSRSAFYFYFPGKAAAVAALLDQRATAVAEGASDWYRLREGPPRERLRLGMEWAVANCRKDAAFLAAMSHAAGSDPEVADLWEAHHASMTQRVATRLRDERAVGIATDGPPAPLCSELLVSMNQRVLEREARRTLAGRRPTRGLVDALTEIWFRALYRTDDQAS
jgi:TetR/AcrR family transcriptional regulator, ethionamide resistance regulator